MTHRVAERERMVCEQIAERGIRDPDVLRVMRSTPRHLFVPAELRPMAYEDCPLSIGYGATISQPYIVARMTGLLSPAKHHRVLEVGTGSGYQAAILGQLVDEVYSIEIVPQLARAAAGRLRELGYSNVTVRESDGYQGWPDQAPFDRVIVTAAPLAVAAELIKQLCWEGRLVAPVGPLWDQHLIVLETTKDGGIRRKSFGAVSFVPMESDKEIEG